MWALNTVYADALSFPPAPAVSDGEDRLSREEAEGARDNC